MSLYSIKKINRIILVLLISIIIACFSTFSWLIFNDNVKSWGLILFIIFLIGYIIFCLVLDSFAVFLVVSIMSLMIGTKIHVNPINDYFSGVGASSLFISVVHIVFFLGLISFVIKALKNEKIINDLTNFNSKFYLVFIFIIYSFLIALTANFKDASFAQFSHYLSLFGVYSLWIIMFRNFSKKKLLSIIIYSLSTVVIIEFILLALQLIEGSPLGLSLLGEGRIGQRIGVPFASVTGTFGHPGPLSMFFLAVSLIFFPFVLQKKYKILLFSFILACLGIVFTFSRTSIIIFCLLIMVELFFLQKFAGKKILSKSKIIILIIVFFLGISVMSPFIISRFDSLQNSNDDQFGNRYYHNLFAFEYIKERPMLGYGLNNWIYSVSKENFIASEYNDPFFFKNPVHNIYLLVWFEGGIVYLLIFLSLFLVHIKFLFRRFKQNSDPFILGIGISIVSFMLYGFLGKALHSYSQLLYLLFFLFAVINHFQTINDKNDR
ncbi:O-antigen ligase family protein [Niallia circulans]|uniref:O-antigen ligase family protein n=1 Tax=Niallia circulans TaxID=1397 RepID=UPI003D9874AB